MCTYVKIFEQVRANPEYLLDIYNSCEPPELKSKEELETFSNVTKGHWNKKLTDFQKLLFIKIFAKDKVIFLFSSLCYKKYIK